MTTLVHRCPPCLAALLLCAPTAWAAGSADIPVDPAQESALLAAAGQGFHVKRTPHFLVAYNTPRALVDEFTARIEQTSAAIYRFCETNKVPARRADRRLEVLFFNQRDEYDHYSAGLSFPSGGTYGVYHEPSNRSAFFNVATDPQLLRLHADIASAKANLDTLSQALKGIRDNRTPLQLHFQDGRVLTLTRPQAEKQVASVREELNTLDARRSAYSDRINRTVIQHEVAHQVLFNAGVHVRGAANPKWLVEGLACLFETPPDATGSGIAAVNQSRLRDFRTAVAGAAERRKLTAEDFVAAVSTERLPPPAKLVSDSRLFEERGDRGTANYAEAWALAQYLHRARGGQLAGYIQEVAARPPGAQPTPAEELALFEKHFGDLDQGFLRRWGDFILKIPVRSTGGL